MTGIEAGGLTAHDAEPTHVDPAYRTTETGITILCPECGTMVEVRDVRAVLLTLHLRNDCDISGLFSHGGGE